MNNLTNEKGITLLALVITIIILLILSGIAIPAGRDTIEKSKLTTFGTELQIMQRKVDELEQKLQSGDESVLEIGYLPQATEQESKALSGAGESSIEGYKYYSKYIIEDLGLSNIKNEFLVNVKKRSVIALNGIPYKGRIIYTVDKLEDYLYKVDYKKEESEDVTFDLSTSDSSLTITNIQYSRNVKKGTIYYGQGSNENSVKWQTAKANTTDTSCNIEVDNEGTWYVKIVDSLGNESEVKNIKKYKNLLKGQELELYKSADTMINNNGTYTITCATKFGGLYLPENLLQEEKKYLLSYNIQKISGDLKNINGHSKAAIQQKFTIDGINSITPYQSNESGNIVDDTNIHEIKFEFLYSPTSTTDANKNIYIQPNRACADTYNVTVKISNIALYEI